MTNENKYNDFQPDKKENPFVVPENYFQDFDSNMMRKIKGEDGTFKVPVRQMMKPYLYIAAGFLLFFTIGRLVLTNMRTEQQVDLASNTLTLEQEMDIIYSEVDEFTITDYLLENDLNGSETVE